MTANEFKNYIEKDLKWHWELSDTNPNKVTVVFDSSLPSLDFFCEANAYFIAPGFRKLSLMRSEKKGYGGSLTRSVPRWYPIPDAGWHKFSAGRVEDVYNSYGNNFNVSPSLSSFNWYPIGQKNFSKAMSRYLHQYCTDIVDGTYDKTYTAPLSEKGKIRFSNLNIYFSVVLVFVDHEGDKSYLLGRSWGVPKSYVSSDF